MLKKILVALDGSETAEHAIPWVKRYAGPGHAQVVLFRGVDPAAHEEESLPSETAEARAYLQRIEADLHYAGIPTKAVVQVGPAAETLVGVAGRETCDLILMTTRGGSPVKRWVLGGVTERVLRLSPIPVLALRSRTKLPKQGRIRRILVPLDGSKLAESSIPWVRRLARFFKSQVVFIHVYPLGPSGLKVSHSSRYDALHKRITRLIQGWTQAGVKASFKLQRGDAAERLICFADRNDLIVTTTHGSGGFKRMIFGSVTEKLIRDAEVPVLVYKSKDQVHSPEGGGPCS